MSDNPYAVSPAQSGRPAIGLHSITFPIHEHVRCSLEDYVVAFDIHDGPHVIWMRRAVAVMCCLMGTLALVVRLMSGSVAYLVIAIFFFSIGVIVGRMRGNRARGLKKQLKATNALEEEIQFEISTEFIRVETMAQDTKRKWSSFVSAKDSGDFVLAYIHKKQFQFIPVGQFSPAGQNAVRQLLKANGLL